MHPDPRFRPDGSALLIEAERIGFAHIFAVTAQGPMVVQAPVTLHGDRLRFHVSRGNRITPHLDGASLVLSLAAAEGYVSANFYDVPGNQVPTWNYVTIEVDGVAHAIDAAALTEQLDRLAALHEPRDDPWMRTKVDPAVFATLLSGIRGFEVAITAVRGTTKLSQNKTPADRAGVISGLRREGRQAIADRMAERQILRRPAGTQI